MPSASRDIDVSARRSGIQDGDVADDRPTAMREAAILWTGWERCSRSVPPSLSVQYVETLIAALTCMDGGGVPKARGQARVRGEGGGGRGGGDKKERDTGDKERPPQNNHSHRTAAFESPNEYATSNAKLRPNKSPGYNSKSCRYAPIAFR